MVPSTRSKRYRNFRRLAQELIKFFLECGRCPIHGLTPIMAEINPPKSPRSRNLPQNARVLLLTILDPRWNRQKLTSTPSLVSQNFAVASRGLPCYDNHHSKPSVVFISDRMLIFTLFENRRGFSSPCLNFYLVAVYGTLGLGSGLVLCQTSKLG